MATEITLVDDLDRSIREGVEGVVFAHEGTTYSIDLGKANRDALAKALAPFIAKATVKGSGRRPLAEIREWARKHGGEIAEKAKSDKGAIPRAVLDAYNAAHGTKY